MILPCPPEGVRQHPSGDTEIYGRYGVGSDVGDDVGATVGGSVGVAVGDIVGDEHHSSLYFYGLLE